MSSLSQLALPTLKQLQQILQVISNVIAFLALNLLYAVTGILDFIVSLPPMASLVSFVEDSILHPSCTGHNFYFAASGNGEISKHDGALEVIDWLLCLARCMSITVTRISILAGTAMAFSILGCLALLVALVVLLIVVGLFLRLVL